MRGCIAALVFGLSLVAALPEVRNAAIDIQASTDIQASGGKPFVVAQSQCPNGKCS